MTKIIKSVTLIAGEKFVLPPLAVLKGSTNAEAFTSTCAIPTLEQLNCYIAVIGSNRLDSDSGYYEGPQAAIIGYRLNGIETLFTTAYQGSNPLGFFDLTSMTTELITDVPGIIATATGTHGDSSRGQLSYILIQTLPSIANVLEILYRGTAPLDIDPQGNTAAISRVPFRLRSTVISDGYEEVPECPDLEEV